MARKRNVTPSVVARRPSRAVAVQSCLKGEKGEPRGVLIAVVGPDGAGKSTLASDVSLRAGGRVIHKYWRPGLLPMAGAVVGRTPDTGPNTNPHGHRSNGVVLATVRTLYYFCDFVLGYFVKIYPSLRRGSNVLIERGWEDMVVDPKRYRLRSHRLLKVLTPLVPRAHYTVVLSPSVSTVLARKAELTGPEIERQLTAWRSAARSRRATVVFGDETTLADAVAKVLVLCSGHADAQAGAAKSAVVEERAE